jgi:hypothetical protein
LVSTTCRHFIQRQVFDRHGGRADARVVEQQVDAAPGLQRRGEQRLDRGRVADVRRHGQDAVARAAFAGDLLENLPTAAGDRHPPAVGQQRERGGLADAGIAAGDDGDLAARFPGCHENSPCGDARRRC